MKSQVALIRFDTVKCKIAYFSELKNYRCGSPDPSRDFDIRIDVPVEKKSLPNHFKLNRFHITIIYLITCMSLGAYQQKSQDLINALRPKWLLKKYK